jgi:hypothetical protein
MERECRIITINGEVYILDGHDHKTGGWCLFYNSPSKVLEEGPSPQIKSRVIVSEDEVELLNPIRAKKGLEPLKVGDISSMTHVFHGESMSKIIATTDQELIDDGIPSINKEDLSKGLKKAKGVVVEFSVIWVGQCNCPCHQPGARIMHVMACCHPTRIESPKTNEDGSIVIKEIC